MKKPLVMSALQASVPNPPALFTHAMHDTLAGIVQAEAGRVAKPARMPIARRRIIIAVIVAALLITSAAIAAVLISGNVFDYTMGTTPENAGSITQRDLADVPIGNAEIRVVEAAYDGISLFISYSIRDLNATNSMGVQDDPSGMRLLTQDDYDQMAALGVGWWVDNLWIDGKSVDMPNMSGGLDVGTETPGEILYSMLYRLDQEEVYLDGKAVQISLPIGERQSLDSLVIDRENNQIELPNKGMVTFTLDCSIRDQITSITPDIETITPRWTARVSSAVFTPIQTYITVDWAIDPSVMQKYIDQNGEGYKDKQGTLLWTYNGVDAAGYEIQSLQLVDRSGNPVFAAMEGFYGNQGVGPAQAWFTFPFSESLPDELYLAPDTGSGANMSAAIRVR